VVQRAYHSLNREDRTQKFGLRITVSPISHVTPTEHSTTFTMATEVADVASAPHIDLKKAMLSNARISKSLYSDSSSDGASRKRIRLDPSSDLDLTKEAIALRLTAEYKDLQILPEALAAKQAAAAGARRKAAKKTDGDATLTADEAKARKMIEGIQESKPLRPGSGPQSNALVLGRRQPSQANGARQQQPGQQLIRAQDVVTQPRPEWHAPWKLMRVISGHLGWVRALAVEPENKWFASGAGDRTIKIWDMASGNLRLTLTGHISTIRGLAVSPRHPYLFSCAEDKMVKCWDLETNKVIRHYHGHLSGVYTLALHPTLDVLVTGGRDGAARVWDMRTRSNIHVLSGHTGTVADLVCQEADPQVITGSLDSTVRMWVS